MHIKTRHGIQRNISSLICYEINKNIRNILLSILCLGITACGGGGSGGDVTSPQTIQLAGSVGDGPVTGSNITVTNSEGHVIATSVSDSTASYNINIPAETSFPVTITSTGGIDIVTGTAPDFTMISTAIDKQNLSNNNLIANINPFSTFMVKMSRHMQGGMTRTNLARAKQVLLQKFNFGLDAGTIPDPIDSKLTPANVASVVKASEAMGEMIRRTRDTFISSGNQINGDYVISALSGDIADGKIDGLGTNAIAKLTATAKLISAQVLIEVLGNRLKVNNADATELLDNAIKVTEPDASMTTANVMITIDLLNQARDSIAAVRRYSSTAAIINIENILSTLNGDIYPSDINNVLPSDAGDSLSSFISSISSATDEDLDKINHNNTESTTQTAPVITTVAIENAQVGASYRYDVNATDENSDDILSYVLVTAPDGMSIDTSTGIITWTPSSTQTGSQTISVKVSDNASPVLSTSQDYTIQVAPAPVVNTAPTISTVAATTARVDSLYQYDVNASDNNPGDILTYSLTSSPAGMSINPQNGLITWTPSTAQEGANKASVRVTDNANPSLSVTQNFTIQVSPTPVINVAPVISTTANLTAQYGIKYIYDVNASDENKDDVLTYSLTTAPDGMTIVPSTGFISWTPTETQANTQTISVKVSDSASPSLSANQSFTIQVSPAPVINVRPVITTTAITTAQIGKAYRYDVDAKDDNSNDILTYSLVTAPNGMSINSASGIVTWSPSDSQAGANNVTIRVSDNASSPMSVSQTYTLHVIAAEIEILRINAGGEQYTDSKGHVWSADYGYNLGSTTVRTDAINGTTDDILYQTERWHDGWRDSSTPEMEYKFNVTSGMYALRLHFAEVTTGLVRKFDVEVEGNLAINDLDIVSEAGRFAPLVKTVITEVSDNEINIRLLRDTKSPQISAIEIIPVSTQTSASTTNTDAAIIQAPEAISTSGTLTIFAEPANGTAIVNGGSITYTANNGFDGKDTIIYRFVDEFGSVTISSITVTVACTTCDKETIVMLSWLANTEEISGYRIYYGPDSANATELKTDIPVNSGLIDPSAPQTTYSAISDLNYYPGEQVCFTVQAYKNDQTSSFSEPVCGTI